MKSAKCDYCKGFFQVLIYHPTLKKKACLGDKCLSKLKKEELLNNSTVEF